MLLRKQMLILLMLSAGGLLSAGCANSKAAPAAHEAHASSMTTQAVQSKSEATPPLLLALDPTQGRDIGMTFEAFLSPHQEPGEEVDTPARIPKAFQSTAPSKTRAEREADGHRGHGVVRFSRDLSRAYVDVKIEGIDVSTINMFHIHCGKPGVLGPILVDFALSTDLQKDLADGVLSVELNNESMLRPSEHDHGPMSAFTKGCLIGSPSLGGLAPERVSTIAGMAQIALEGELYFNLHTTAQTYFGDIRGQIHRADPEENTPTAP